MEEKKLVGKVTHYYNRIGVAIIKLDEDLQYGDEISIEGGITNIQETVDSMQFEHKPIKNARKGEEVALKVKDAVRPGDFVYKTEE